MRSCAHLFSTTKQKHEKLKLDKRLHYSNCTIAKRTGFPCRAEGEVMCLLLFSPGVHRSLHKDYVAIRDDIATLQQCQPLKKSVGISVDSVFTLNKFKTRPVHFPLLSDFNKEVSTAYGSVMIGFLDMKVFPNAVLLLLIKTEWCVMPSIESAGDCPILQAVMKPWTV